MEAETKNFKVIADTNVKNLGQPLPAALRPGKAPGHWLSNVISLRLSPSTPASPGSGHASSCGQCPGLFDEPSTKRVNHCLL